MNFSTDSLAGQYSTNENDLNESMNLRLGRVSSIATGIITTVFAISLIWEMINLSEFTKNLGYVSSILIAIGVVLMMACFYNVTQKKLKIFGLLALVSSTIYASLCISVYFLQLSIVASNPLKLTSEVLEIIIFKPGSPTFAIDMLGYCFLCLSTLAAGFALRESKDKALRVLCFLHGTLATPPLFGALMSELYLSESGEADFTGYFVLLFWCIVLIPIALLFAKYFKEKLLRVNIRA